MQEIGRNSKIVAVPVGAAVNQRKRLSANENTSAAGRKRPHAASHTDFSKPWRDVFGSAPKLDNSKVINLNF